MLSYGPAKLINGTLCICLSQGRVAALNMIGRPTEVKTVPYFWTAMFGKSIRYAGKAIGVMQRAWLFYTHNSCVVQKGTLGTGCFFFHVAVTERATHKSV